MGGWMKEVGSADTGMWLVLLVELDAEADVEYEGMWLVDVEGDDEEEYAAGVASNSRAGGSLLSKKEA